MGNAVTRAIADSLVFLVQPLARFCVRRSMRLQDVVEALKHALVEAAYEEVNACGIAPSTSKLSIMTGVHRRDVVRILSRRSKNKDDSGLLSRIIGQWRNDKRFCTAGGRPRVLECEGKDSEFVRLVRSVSKDVNPYAVLFEIERMGAVERASTGLQLRSQIFVPVGDIRQGLKLLAADANDLFEGVERNIFEEPEVPNLHIKTHYDNISVESEDEIKLWLLREGTEFHRRVSEYLSQFDCDINPKLSEKSGGTRVALGAFSVLTPAGSQGGKENRRALR